MNHCGSSTRQFDTKETARRLLLTARLETQAAHASVAHALSHANPGTRARRITHDEWELKGGQRLRKKKKLVETIARLENDAVPITSTVVGIKLARPSLPFFRARTLGSLGCCFPVLRHRMRTNAAYQN